MDAIRERLEESAQSGDLIPLEQAFMQIEELHQTYSAKKLVGSV